jgi:hypothetical protein
VYFLTFGLHFSFGYHLFVPKTQYWYQFQQHEDLRLDVACVVGTPIPCDNIQNRLCFGLDCSCGPIDVGIDHINGCTGAHRPFIRFCKLHNLVNNCSIFQFPHPHCLFYRYLQLGYNTLAYLLRLSHGCRVVWTVSWVLVFVFVGFGTLDDLVNNCSIFQFTHPHCLFQRYLQLDYITLAYLLQLSHGCRVVWAVSWFLVFVFVFFCKVERSFDKLLYFSVSSPPLPFLQIPPT